MKAIFGTKLAPITAEDNYSRNRWDAIKARREHVKLDNDIENGLYENTQIYIPELEGTHKHRSIWRGLLNNLKELLP